MSRSPEFDIAVAVPALAEVRDLATAGDYDALSRLVIALNDEDESSMPAVSGVVAEAPGVDDVLRRRLDAEPRDFLARTLLAHHHIVHGWEARSGYRAEHVSAGQFEAFHAALRLAEVDLIRVCAEDPSWSLPWVLRLMTARGLELGAGETRRRYQRLCELVPHHFDGQRQMLQRLCPKWGGTWEEAFGFVRSNAADAPPGSPVPALVAQAHLERWLELPAGPGRDYLRQRDVRHEVGVAAAASVLSARSNAGTAAVPAHPLFAVVHALAGDTDAATPHFQALGDVVDEGVWGYLGSSEAAVNRCRTAALRKRG